MELLSKIFLILTIAVPLFFIIIMIIARKKVKRNKVFRNRLLLCTFASFLLNGLIYGAITTNLSGKNVKNIENDTKKDSTVQSSSTIEESSESVESTGSTESTTQKEEQKSSTTTSTKSNNMTTSNNSNTGANTNTSTSTGTTSKGYKIETINGVTYIDGFIIANKTYPLPESYVPTGTHKAANSQTTICQECIDETSYQAYVKMRTDAANNGLTLWIASGYRSYNYQKALYQSYVKRSGQAAADTYSARAGHSEHQTGFAFDLNTVSDAFASTSEGIWVNSNCYKYGFIIRYPKGKENETGYKYESWHLRYVGVDLATKLYNNGDWITLEDYFGITSKYNE